MLESRPLNSVAAIISGDGTFIMDPIYSLLLLAQELDPEPPRPATLLESPIFLLLMMVGFFYFFLIRPQRKEQKEKEQLRNSLQKNDRVVTTGGLIGTIINVKEEEVTLRIDDQAKVKARFLRSAVSRVLQGSSTSSAEAKKG